MAGLIGQGTWRAVKPAKSDQWELFDLATDPSEAKNVAATQAETLSRLVALATKAHHPQSRIGFEADYCGAAYPYGDPGETAKKLDAQRRDSRMGICFDTGHAARSGLDIVEVTRVCGNRLRSLHLKDVARVQVNDVPFGTGRVDVAAVLAELKRQGFQGHIGLEYENFKSPTFAEDLRQMVRFVCEQGK